MPSVIDSSPFFSGLPLVKKLNIDDPCESVQAIIISLFFDFSPTLTPVKVPPVPIAHVKPSILPSVCVKISADVVFS